MRLLLCRFPLSGNCLLLVHPAFLLSHGAAFAESSQLSLGVTFWTEAPGGNTSSHSTRRQLFWERRFSPHSLPRKQAVAKQLSPSAVGFCPLCCPQLRTPGGCLRRLGCEGKHPSRPRNSHNLLLCAFLAQKRLIHSLKQINYFCYLKKKEIL